MAAMISLGRIGWASCVRSMVGGLRVGIVLPSDGGGKKVCRRRSHFCVKSVVVEFVSGFTSGGMLLVWVGLVAFSVFQIVVGVDR